MQNDPSNREANHAKLLQHEQRQVIAFLYRDEDDALCVALQLWVAVTDEQLRVAVALDDDDQAQAFFDHLSNDTIGDVLGQMSVLNDITRLEEALS